MLGKFWTKKEGRESADSKPIALPVGISRPPTLQEQIARLVRDEQYKAFLNNRGLETFEEADDFDVGDDFDPTTPYEDDFDLATIAAADKGIVQQPNQSFSRFVEERPDVNRRLRGRRRPAREGGSPGAPIIAQGDTPSLPPQEEI